MIFHILFYLLIILIFYFFYFINPNKSSKVTNNLSERSFSVINSKQKNEIDDDNDKNENGKTDTYPSGSYVISSKKNEFISLSPEKLKLISAYGANVQLLLKDCDDVIISRYGIPLHLIISNFYFFDIYRLETFNLCFFFLSDCQIFQCNFLNENHHYHMKSFL